MNGFATGEVRNESRFNLACTVSALDLPLKDLTDSRYASFVVGSGAVLSPWLPAYCGARYLYCSPAYCSPKMLSSPTDAPVS